MSRDIRHDLDKIMRKNDKGEIADPGKEVVDLFIKRLPVPPPMAEELAIYVMSVTDRDKAKEISYDIEALFAEEFDINETVLTGEDWAVIRDLANSYGEELDLKKLTYIMRKAVEYGAFKN